ncbi:hypothetical protein [Mycolicibacterium komossense]|uniref:Minor tail protein n=1 Tax=Mycolicibacterium komossense TaxID=1779 RepID=A0ABT3CE76_9MYCO|nr:hypothetical protein [Mycolicibacterium komossense]MCV7227785.1 hypothetical protein [Mycolicibacterium komossense]
MSPVAVVPRATVTATVTTSTPVRTVTAARLEWGYTNFFDQDWAGKSDSAAARGSEVLSAVGEVGITDPGDRSTDEWVCVSTVDLPVPTSEFTGGSWTFRVPSWAPASSKEIARWSARLIVERGGHDIDAHGEFTVRIGRNDVFDFDGLDEPVEVVSGAAETVIDIVLPTTIFLAGEAVNGRAFLTPTVDLPDGDLAVCWQRRRASHPLTKNPSEGNSLEGRIIQLDNRITLQSGKPVTLPFAIPLPADAPPTAAAVHSSMDWYVQARLRYAGVNARPAELVVKPIVVINTG